MLKLLSNSINYLENISSHTKCAEIHYITSNFNIVCISCDQFYQELQEFIKHFQDFHLNKFLENVHNYPLLNRKEKSVKQEMTEILIGDDLKVLRNEQATENLSTLAESYEEFKMEEIPERELESNENQMNNITEQEIYISSDKSPECDWSQTFSPSFLKSYEKRPYKPRNQPNSCSYCGKIFRRRYQLDTHLNIHTGVKPHQCDICGRQFRAITTLQRHLNIHVQRHTFRCQFCNKEFTHRAALVSHETRHTQERHIPCEDCSKLFYTHNQLDTHKRKLHNKVEDFSLPFACDMCAKRYRSASMLSTHKFKKHYKLAKFSCEQCDKKFVEQTQLKDHVLRIHFKKC